MPRMPLKRTRITPACAGSTTKSTSTNGPGEDHPRIRGEHFVSSIGLSADTGSPPHTGGALIVFLSPGLVLGITPAYAGSTVKLSAFGTNNQDHPRIRGEHTPSFSGYSTTRGSPPHTRGTPHLCPAAGPRRGITPAYAGNTGELYRPTPALEDHPRIRGEHRHRIPGPDCDGGSPPHTRGAPLISAQIIILWRITPAYAGSTGCAAFQARLKKDHPRIRGEH